MKKPAAIRLPALVQQPRNQLVVANGSDSHAQPKTVSVAVQPVTSAPPRRRARFLRRTMRENVQAAYQNGR